MSADTTPGLAPCPFCGGAMRVQSNRDWHRLFGDHDDGCVWGQDDDAVMMVPAQPDQLAAMVHAWNRRAPAPAPQGPTDAEIEALASYSGARWGGDYWVLEDADLHPFARAVLARWSAPAASGEPVARKPLTDAEINSIYNELCSTAGANYRSVARAIEAAHGIKP